MTREAWCAQHGLNPDHPVILYGLGSPNLSPGERYAVRHLAEAIAQGRLGDAQLLVRPHPLFDDGRLQDEMRSFSPRVIVQKTGDPELAVAARFQSALQIRDWVSTFRHAAVVVNFSSTVVIDAALSDRPVVNLDFDPEPGQPNQQLYRAVNHVWSHFRPLAESGGMWLVNSLDDMTAAVRSYLAHPELHRDQRLAMARRVCGYLDGRCGERMGDTISELVHRWRRSPPAVTGAAPR
jgi:CDP-glycerol glycerophosphotransferase (TagB/SpsB family)